MNTCFNVPTIVYQNSWLGQTSAIALSDIYTIPNSDGQFRVTISLKAVASSGNVIVEADVDYPTSGVSSPSWGMCKATANPSTPSVTTAIVGACSGFVGEASGQVPLNTAISGTGTLDHYDLYVTIEQLQ